ncbi:MAG: NDP-sugar synthase [Chloroflexi bacterium]|nr:NDP-sugar synthase [Chloroflexota bacterium]
MKAIVLVGGEGTRLRPLTCQTPKAMVPVVNRPFLEHMVERLKKHAVDTIVLTLCYLPELIQKYFKDGARFGVKMVYIEEKVPLGTAGAVKNAECLFDEPFFVLNGDVLCDLDYGAMMRAHLACGAVATIALIPVEDVTQFGVVETAPEGRITRFVEKPKANEVGTNMVNAGTYILDPHVLRDMPRNKPVSFERQLFPGLLASGERLTGFPFTGYWIDIGKPDNYMELNYHLLIGARSPGKASSVAGAVVELGQGTSVDPGAIMDAPVVVGERCSIGAGVVIKGPTVIGNGCRIGPGARLDRVIVWNNVSIGKNARLEHCIVANNCLVNDNCCIGEGCVVGDDVKVTPSCVIQPGTKVWPGTLVT